ncbi:hypothetical protein [Nereida sp. MMG025]|uniref:hypothetical protein n=1 Tax=Nereida sp. MMG025 TaxID=2909981 RepID=UPI001F463522|nr:hypothetical protein [Nereida sp. MMG025]MCF6446149.1 hypothetical protein [Nereida sp. MMG025]
MNEEDYRDLINLIRARLEALGLADIADLSNYTDEMEGRRLPDGRTVVKLMLTALDRRLAANDSDVVQKSLWLIGDVIGDGKRPTSARIEHDPERALFEGRDFIEMVEGDHRVPAARAELQNLISALMADDFRDSGDQE